jgi:hypothetical protein
MLMAMLGLPLAVGAFGATLLAIALCAERSPRVAVALSVAQLGLPAVTDAPPWVRFALGLCAALAFFRTWDLSRDALAGPRSRLHHLTAVFDTRLAQPVPPAARPRLLLDALPWLLATIGATVGGLATMDEPHPGAGTWALRWLCAAVVAVSTVEVISRALRFGWVLLGVEPPLLHDSPLLSTSVREFWGQRWNRVVGHWLRGNVYQPVRRTRGPLTAEVATFAASALLHWYLVVVSLDLRMAGLMGAFFLAQAGLMSAERFMGVSRWARPAARVWTVSSILALSPLFLEPMVQLIDRRPLP